MGNLKAFKISAVFVGDKTTGGFENFDSNSFTFELLPNWSDDLTIVTPTFDTDVVFS